MTHRRKFFASILLLLVVAAAIFFLLNATPPEPSYKGRSLSQVVQHLGLRQVQLGLVGAIDAEDREAIRAIGTNGIPHYTRWLAFEPGKLQLAKTFVCEKGHDWFGLDAGYRPDAGFLRQYGVPAALSILGAEARAAIPHLLNQATNSSPPLSSFAIVSLARIGEPAAGATCYLMTNEQLSLSLRQVAVMSCLGARSNAATIVEIQKLLTDGDPVIRTAATNVWERSKGHRRNTLLLP